MNFGFVKTALKTVGLSALQFGEAIAPAAATAFGGPLAGQLTALAIQGIMAAQAKHGPTQASPVSISAGAPLPVGLTKKLDVMQFLETQAEQIAQLVLSSTGRPVQDPERFAVGVDKLVEGLVDILKSIGMLPTAAAAPLMQTSGQIQTVPAIGGLIPAIQSKSDAPAVVPFTGQIANLDPPTPPATQVTPDVIALLREVLARVGPKVTVA